MNLSRGTVQVSDLVRGKLDTLRDGLVAEQEHLAALLNQSRQVAERVRWTQQMIITAEGGLNEAMKTIRTRGLANLETVLAPFLGVDRWQWSTQELEIRIGDELPRHRMSQVLRNNPQLFEPIQRSVWRLRGLPAPGPESKEVAAAT